VQRVLSAGVRQALQTMGSSCGRAGQHLTQAAVLRCSHRANSMHRCCCCPSQWQPHLRAVRMRIVATRCCLLSGRNKRHVWCWPMLVQRLAGLYTTRISALLTQCSTQRCRLMMAQLYVTCAKLVGGYGSDSVSALPTITGHIICSCTIGTCHVYYLAVDCFRAHVAGLAAHLPGANSMTGLAMLFEAVAYRCLLFSLIILMVFTHVPSP
jgi:hypothetical protein